MGASAGAVALTGLMPQALAATCGLTPPQTPGPFYPGEQNFTPENDLTQVPGRTVRALGQVIYVTGKVLDPACRPIEGATVEIWQACASGRYDNPKDENPAPLDANFRYWGEAYSDANGFYSFKTIKPGAYPADATWTRPPHIHFKVSRRGYKELVTQLYFAGDALNDKDLILQNVPKAEQKSVIVNFTPSALDLEPGSLSGTFDITLQSVRG